MQATPHSINIQKTARYFTYGNFSEKTEHIWFLCHGYGQLASYFIKKFEALSPEKHFLVAPEALSRFYIGGQMQGRVGATWMTSEDRLAEIDNYVHYLDQVYQQVFLKNPRFNHQKIHFFGFSQGANTINRWATYSQVEFHSLTVWGGTFPHDLPFDKAQQRYKGKSIYVVYGNKDEFFNEKHFKEHIEDINQKGINTEEIKFEGGHEILATPLLQLAEKFSL